VTATGSPGAPHLGMSDLTRTLVSGQAAPSAWNGADDITQVMRAPDLDAITQVMAAPANANVSAAAQATAAMWDPGKCLDLDDLGFEFPPRIPGRSDGRFLEMGMRGTPGGEAHYEAVKAISDDIAAQKASPAYIASEARAAEMAGIKTNGPTGKAWFDQQYGAGKSAVAAEEELGAVSTVSEVGEELGTLGKISKFLGNPAIAAPLAGLNVLGGAADVYTGVNEVMEGDIGYGMADTAIGFGNMAVGGATLAELAMTGAATAASPVGLALGAAALGVKGDKFLKETGALDALFGKDDEGESYGLVGGIGSVLDKAVHGDGAAIAESVAGLALAPVLIPSLAAAEVGAGLTSVVASGIDFFGGDSAAVGHAIGDTAGSLWDGAKDLFGHFAE